MADREWPAQGVPASARKAPVKAARAEEEASDPGSVDSEEAFLGLE